MEQGQTMGPCKDVLNLVLSFFPRVDSRASVVLAVNTGMLGYLAAHLPPILLLNWCDMIAPVFTLGLLIPSYWNLYRVAFPNLAGGEGSLIYFREIAKRTEGKYIDEFMAQQEADYIKDVLGQAWRNSVILKEKFGHLKLSLIFLVAALLPWLIALADFARLGKHA